MTAPYSDPTSELKVIERVCRWRGPLDPNDPEVIVPKFPDHHGIALTSAECRRILRHLFTTGSSTHSGVASTLWVVLDWLERRKIPYTLLAAPGTSYVVTLRPVMVAPGNLTDCDMKD